MEKKLSLTRDFLRRIKSFSKLGADVKKGLYDKLEYVPLEDFDTGKVKSVFLSVFGGKNKDAESFLSLYMHLLAMQDFTGKSCTELLNSIKLSNEDFPEQEQITQDEFKDIESLLRCSPHVEAGLKALNYQFDHDKTFLDSRIYEELRPVFGMDGNILGSVVTHMLKLTYHKSGNDDDTFSFYVGLDSKDMLQLKEQLESSLKNVGLIEKENDPIKIIRK